MTDRKTASTINDTELDQLYDALDGAYRERAHLVAHLAALYPSHIGRTDPTAPDWPVLIVETPAGQMSWHFAERDLDLVHHVQPTGPEHRGWDGHSTEEKYQRLRALTAAPRTAEAAITRVRAIEPYRMPILGERSRGMQMGWDAALKAVHAALDVPAPATAATQATGGWEQQDDGTWAIPFGGCTVTVPATFTAEERARFAEALKQQEPDLVVTAHVGPGLSPAGRAVLGALTNVTEERPDA